MNANLLGTNLNGAINIPSWIDTSFATLTPPDPAENTTTEDESATEAISEPTEPTSESVFSSRAIIDEAGAEFGYYLCDEDGNPIDYLSVLGNQADNVPTP